MAGTPWRKLRRIALVMVLTGSLAANIVLAWRWVAEVQSVHIARLDPAQLDVYAAERTKLSTAGVPALVFFGDSRALMWPTPPALSGFTVVNRGIGNQTTAQIALRIDADVVPLHPTIVVLEAGVNDLKTIADVPERRARIVADCEVNLRHIVDRCRALGAAVVLVNIFDIGDVPVWRQPFWSNDVATAVREVNHFLATLAGDRVVYLDAAEALDDSRGKVKAAYQLDFLHLAPAGYEALDERLIPVVRRLASATP